MGIRAHTRREILPMKQERWRFLTRDILKRKIRQSWNGAEGYQEIASLDGDQGDGLTESVSAAELTAVRLIPAGQDGNQNRGQIIPVRNAQTEQTGLENPGEAIPDQRHECVRLHSQRPAKQRTDPGKTKGNVVKYHQ